MRQRPRAAVRLCLAILSWVFLSPTAADAQYTEPSDPQADKRTRALYHNLQRVAGQAVLFGQEDALAYGLGWRDERDRSDVKDVCGSHPAVFGWDVSRIGKTPFNIDTVDFDRMRAMIIEAYRMGGINTISWHMDHPVTGGTTWDRTPAVAEILPGGARHAWFVRKLDLFADFVDGLRVGFIFTHRVPIIFRPWHEHTGSWFWWGADHCTPEEYKALWRFTVEYLRDERGLHNLLFAYSPDIVSDTAHYLERYPGDAYVDILGLDDYHDVGPDGRPEQLTRRLGFVARLAAEKGKVAALTETGSNGIPDPNWWTEVLWKHIRADPAARQIAYLLVWRNAYIDHHFGPFPGHASAPDFKRLCAEPDFWMVDDLPRMYR